MTQSWPSYSVGSAFVAFKKSISKSGLCDPRGMSARLYEVYPFPPHFHIEEMRVIEYLLVKHLFVFRLPGAEARVQATITCVAQANDSVPDHVLKLLCKRCCVSLRMLTFTKRVQVPFTTQSRSLTPLRTFRAAGLWGEAMCRTSACASLPVSFGLITPGTVRRPGTLPQ